MIEIEKNIVLAKYTTLGVGGNADYLVVVKSRDELLEALDYAYRNKLKYLVLGGGSNVLVSDEGFAGLVIVNRATAHTQTKDVMYSESGASLTKVASQTLDNGFLGFEFGIGIPGTIGGAVAGNVGTKVGSVSDILVSAEVWHDGKIESLPGDSFDFDYRFSNIKGKFEYVVLSAKFRLQEGDTATAKEQVRAEIARRAGSYKGKTAGSYFKNPSEGKSAAELIDSLGLKGYRVGGAEVSTEHANVFRNLGDATARDFVELEHYVVAQVKTKFDIVLEPEVVKIGVFI